MSIRVKPVWLKLEFKVIYPPNIFKPQLLMAWTGPLWLLNIKQKAAWLSWATPNIFLTFQLGLHFGCYVALSRGGSPWFFHFDPKKEAWIILKNDLRKFQIARLWAAAKSHYFKVASLWATSPSLFLSPYWFLIYIPYIIYDVIT